MRTRVPCMILLWVICIISDPVMRDLAPNCNLNIKCNRKLRHNVIVCTHLKYTIAFHNFLFVLIATCFWLSKSGIYVSQTIWLTNINMTLQGVILFDWPAINAAARHSLKQPAAPAKGCYRLWRVAKHWWRDNQKVERPAKSCYYYYYQFIGSWKFATKHFICILIILNLSRINSA